MIKKVTLILILAHFIISCGKKGDPEYKQTTKKPLIEKTFINKT
tara:strand:+ start:1374 stop:1505 length:132 start_codon:yes stop_codon:yes gene_type:complete